MEDTALKSPCINHPQVESEYTCQQCRAAVCKTCAILFYGTTHLCPACASNADNKLHPAKRKKLVTAYVIAIANTLLIALFFITAIVAPELLVGVLSNIYSLLFLIGAIAGTAMGFSAMTKQAKNPLVVWGAAVWNLVYLILYFILVLIGSVR